MSEIQDISGDQLVGPDWTRSFVRVPKIMLRSKEYAELNPRARAAYLEIASLYNGHNNGVIACAAGYLAKQLRCSKSSAARAVQKLILLGFIEIVETGRFAGYDSYATTYRITLFDCDETGKKANPPFLGKNPTALNYFAARYSATSNDDDF